MELKLNDMQKIISGNHDVMRTLFYDYSNEWLETNLTTMSKRVKVEWSVCSSYDNFKERLSDLEVCYGENYVLGESETESVNMFKWLYIRELLKLINSYEMVQEALN
jgi:hypothetical protein